MNWDEVCQPEGRAHWECSVKVCVGVLCSGDCLLHPLLLPSNLGSEALLMCSHQLGGWWIKPSGFKDNPLLSLVCQGRENDGLLSAASQTKYLAFTVWRAGFAWTWVLFTMIKGALTCREGEDCNVKAAFSSPFPLLSQAIELEPCKSSISGVHPPRFI